MRKTEIPASITITAPAVYAGTYTDGNGKNSELRVWYFEGTNKDAMPHFSVGSRDDAAPSWGGNARWFRFHVTIGFASGKSVANGHIFYTFGDNGIVSRKYTNADELSSGPRGILEALITTNGAVYDQLAQAFVTAAGVALVTPKVVKPQGGKSRGGQSKRW